MIYLDNSATTFPKPQNIVNAFRESMAYGGNPGRSGHTLSVKTGEKVYQVRKKVGEFFNFAKTENVIFTQNCTHSINIAMRGVIPENTHFIITSLEHNSVWRTAYQMKNEGKWAVSIADVDELNTENTVKNLEKCIRKDTSAIVCTHASNVTGAVLPAKEIGGLCKKYGLKFILDTAQTAGKIPIDAVQMNIACLCAPGHKGLYGLTGTGLLLVMDEGVKPFIFGGTGSESLLDRQPDFLPDRLETGTLNVPGILSLGEGIDFINREGIEKIRKKESVLCNMLYDFLGKKEGVILYSKKENNAGIVTFNYKDKHSEETANYLNEHKICTRGGFHCSALAHRFLGTSDRGAVRMSTGYFNSPAEINYVLDVLDKM